MTFEGFKKYSGPAAPMFILLIIYLIAHFVNKTVSFLYGEGMTIHDIPFIKRLVRSDRDEIVIKRTLFHLLIA